MKRLVMIGTTLVVLIGAAAAYAALNNYTAGYKFGPNKTGSAKSPVPLSITEDYSAKNSNPALRTAPLQDIKTKIYGIKADSKDFPTCSMSKIANAKSDASCPKKAMVASGFITAQIGSATDQTIATGLQGSCDPLLHVWNSGGGKLTFFFVTDATHQCLNGGITTGTVAPYPGTIAYQGKYMVLDVPVPSYVSYPVTGLEGSLVTEHLVFAKNTTKVKGKTVGMEASVGCLKGKRPVTTTYTAQASQGAPSESFTVSGSYACTK